MYIIINIIIIIMYVSYIAIYIYIYTHTCGAVCCNAPLSAPRPLASCRLAVVAAVVLVMVSSEASRQSEFLAE